METRGAQGEERITVGEFVARNPHAKRVLEDFGIDYCCGGGQGLAEAAAAKGMKVGALLERVAAAAAAPGQRPERIWADAGVGELIEHLLSTHHAFMKREMPRIDDLLRKVSQAHGEHHGPMLRDLGATFQAFRAEIEDHLMKEEQILFPTIGEMDAYARTGGEKPQAHCGSVEYPIRQMEYEHNSAGDALKRMRAIASEYRPPADACPTFAALYEALAAVERDLHEHIHLESNVLFPRSIALERTISG